MAFWGGGVDLREQVLWSSSLFPADLGPPGASAFSDTVKKLHVIQTPLYLDFIYERDYLSWLFLFYF